MSENSKNFESISAGRLGEIDVTAWRILGNTVRVAVDGPLDIGLDLSPKVARELAEKLIAAADFAEGKA